MHPPKWYVGSLGKYITNYLVVDKFSIFSALNVDLKVFINDSVIRSFFVDVKSKLFKEYLKTIYMGGMEPPEEFESPTC